MGRGLVVRPITICITHLQAYDQEKKVSAGLDEKEKEKGETAKWCMNHHSRVSGFGFRVAGFWFRASGIGFLVPGFGYLVPGFGFQVSVSGLRVSGSGNRVHEKGDDAWHEMPLALVT